MLHVLVAWLFHAKLLRDLYILSELRQHITPKKKTFANVSIWTQQSDKLIACILCCLRHVAVDVLNVSPSHQKPLPNSPSPSWLRALFNSRFSGHLGNASSERCNLRLLLGTVLAASLIAGLALRTLLENNSSPSILLVPLSFSIICIVLYATTYTCIQQLLLITFYSSSESLHHILRRQQPNVNTYSCFWELSNPVVCENPENLKKTLFPRPNWKGC